MRNRPGFLSGLVIIVLIPLIFDPGFTRNVFEIWKVGLFAAAIAGLLPAWLLKCKRGGQITINISHLTPLLTLLIITYLFAAIFSVDHNESIFGTYGRFEGILVIWGYLLVGLIIPTLIDNKEIDRLLFAWLLTGILVSIYGLLQFIGIDFQNWRGSFVGSRVFSTFGNPLTLSSYIVLTLPIAYARATNRREIVSIIFILLAVPTLLFTYSRSGWLAFILVTLLYIAFVFWCLRANRSEHIFKSPLLWVFLAMIVFGVIVIGYVGDLGPRLVSIFDLRSGTIATRLNLWKLTLRMISERPFLGYGPETYLQISNRFLDLTQQSIELNTRYDRPHNDLLQVAFSTGLVGLLAYMALIYAYFSGVLRFLRKGVGSSGALNEVRDIYNVAGLALGVLGYLVAIQFFFSTVAVTPLMWLSIGLTTSLTGIRKKVLLRWVPKFATPVAAGVCLLILLPFLLNISSDILARQAVGAEARKDYKAAVNYAALATRLSPWQAGYLLEQGQELEKSGDLSGAMLVYRRSIELSPARYDGYANLAALYYQQGDNLKAENYALKALQRYPLQYESRMIYALVSAMNGDNKTAEENLSLLQKIDSGDYRGYLYLGLLFADTGRSDLAREQLKKALALNPTSSDAKQALARIGNKN